VRKRRTPAGKRKSRPDRRLTAAEKALVVAHLPVVRKVAIRIFRRVRWAHVNELESAGALGLMDAAKRFDPGRGKPFADYAEWRIKGAIIDYLRETDAISRDMRRWANAIRDAEHDLCGRLGRRPSQLEVAEELGLTLDQLDVRRQKLSGHTLVPFDDEDTDVLDQITASDGRGASAFDRIAQEQARRSLGEAIATLPKRTQQALALRFVEDITLREIGQVMGYTESRACQVIADATRALRALLGPDVVPENG
jgi:RNA polymerase sigma factor FliA